MSVPLQCRPTRRRRSVKPAIMLTLAFALTGIYVQFPPLPPPGYNPWGSRRKECPNCGNPVRPARDGHCYCKNCRWEFEAEDAKDYL
jgi:hypothetical protein